ncbi:unnamed protein product [Closterium sp. Naga37s-1]|nr:unnamed protein product [Closterium sp. Naga37s-1]
MEASCLASRSCVPLTCEPCRRIDGSLSRSRSLRPVWVLRAARHDGGKRATPAATRDSAIAGAADSARRRSARAKITWGRPRPSEAGVRRRSSSAATGGGGRALSPSRGKIEYPDSGVFSVDGEDDEDSVFHSVVIPSPRATLDTLHLAASAAASAAVSPSPVSSSFAEPPGPDSSAQAAVDAPPPPPPPPATSPTSVGSAGHSRGAVGKKKSRLAKGKAAVSGGTGGGGFSERPAIDDIKKVVSGDEPHYRHSPQEYEIWHIDDEGKKVTEKLGGSVALGRTWWETASAAATRPALQQELMTLAKEPVYQVLEVNGRGDVWQREVSRRQLLKLSGLTQRDVRRIDPSLWVTNSMPAILVRDSAILLNLGSLRAISTAHTVLIFDYNSVGAQSFVEVLLERLRLDADVSISGGPAVPFELEVVESALISRTQRLESALMDIEPRVLALLEVLPNRLTADNLEELRLSKQALVELGSKAGALRQMLLELLEHTNELRRITAIDRQCRVNKDGGFECPTAADTLLAEEEEQEIEMVFEYYLQRCESCHGQSEKLLDSAKEMEDSIAVNLSSRRLEVGRLELLLQVGTFAAALGALIAGIFGMNLRNRLEESALAFWTATFGIVFGGVLLFLAMLAYLKHRRIL